MASSGGSSRYRVQRRDSLWKIAGKSRIYGDSFKWPLLFIANRSLIQDPDIIHIGWNLKVKRNLSSDSVAEAVQKAKETPRYQPHSAPREHLPIDY